jgi:hypothetical protein
MHGDDDDVDAEDEDAVAHRRAARALTAARLAQLAQRLEGAAPS